MAEVNNTSLLPSFSVDLYIDSSSNSICRGGGGGGLGGSNSDSTSFASAVVEHENDHEHEHEGESSSLSPPLPSHAATATSTSSTANGRQAVNDNGINTAAKASSLSSPSEAVSVSRSAGLMDTRSSNDNSNTTSSTTSSSITRSNTRNNADAATSAAMATAATTGIGMPSSTAVASRDIAALGLLSSRDADTDFAPVGVMLDGGNGVHGNTGDAAATDIAADGNTTNVATGTAAISRGAVSASVSRSVLAKAGDFRRAVRVGEI
mmetsp:Transcript_11500/g.24232  ORF Transcript_11500/g.24232 Transcript_11500/m.24232 type:complete len:265 (-) Transcript_11500:226-1020(-)